MRTYDFDGGTLRSTTDGCYRLVMGTEYWAAKARNRRATRASTVESGSIRDRARRNTRGR